MRIAETFLSIQGEGSLTGVPTYFVRMAGCSVATCPLHPSNGNTCDTDWRFRFDAEPGQLAKDAKASGAHWLCITGGEPTDDLPSLHALTEAAHRLQMRVSLQTSGIRKVNDVFDWLVVSPKCDDALQLAQNYGHELKLIYRGQDRMRLFGWWVHTKFMHYYLQPYWREGGCNHTATIEAALEKGAGEWRVSAQMHKYWGVR